MQRGMPISCRLGSCQSSVCRSISIVRLALVTSVACTPPSGPPVRFHSSHASMFPNASSPFSARVARVLDVVEDPGDLRAGEVGRQRQPDALAQAVEPLPPASSRTSAAVRVSCQTIALCTGSPV